ncbi:MAG: hypothetical protein WA192_04120 [Candidatus Acidiferrales bacterium]
MRRALVIFAALAWLLGCGAMRAAAQSRTYDELPAPDSANSAGGSGEQQVDGVAARIEDDIITESEVRELADFQVLVDGKAKPRMELIRELTDQWMVRNEATATKYAPLAAADVDRAYAEFMKQFPSPEDFERRRAAAGLTEAAVRRMVAQQLYLSRFIDYRFRPEAQVSDEQVEAYYHDEFAPQLKAAKKAVPPLEDVEDTIREVLIQRAISDRAAKWMDDTRERLKIDIVAPGSGS